MHQNSPFSDQK